MATFKTRARALDMLGRQQIAGRPTAISELFKNAHDAYADRVEVDYYRSDGLFVLRDDGLGMTRDDFDKRWLTLGTESKLGLGIGLPLPPVDPDKPPRPTLGEKGIGRLAIAAIGPQVLILTRAKRGATLDDLVAAFIHWGIFESPGLDMDQVDFPLTTFPGGSLPVRDDVLAMVNAVRQNVIANKRYLQPFQLKRILAELDTFSLDPDDLDRQLKAPSLRADGHGTQFYVLPADESLAADIDGTGDDSTPPLQKMLVGFTNTMTPGHGPVRIQSAFRDHKTDDDCEDLIEERTFFTPEEFKNADHHIEGAFDDYGQFNGTVTVYDGSPVRHVVPWTEARGKRTECGSFSISVAYVQGVARESKLPPDEWSQMITKLNRMGGLYIYRDGIRVLPYGDTDFDWLDIEKYRTKGASYYFFSHRRMFGVIELTHGSNPGLSEKAGREGFRENKAYRQFRDVLRNFFRQIAADFFRQGGPQADQWTETKAELDLNERIRRDREKQVTVRRKALGEALESGFEKIEARRPEEEVQNLLNWLERELTKASSISNPDLAAQAIIDAEAGALRKLDGMRDGYRVVRPHGIGLTRQLLRDWGAYSTEYKRLQAEVFAPARQRIDDLVGQQSHHARLAIDLRKRIERAVHDRVDYAQRTTNAGARDTRQALDDVQTRVLALTKESIAEVDSEMNQVLSELSRTDFSEMDEAEAVGQRESFEQRIITIAERRRELLEIVRDQLRAINLTPDEGGAIVGVNQVSEAMEEELLALREKSEADIELAQLGMAIGVINHEFGATVKSLRTNLRRLQSWAEVNDGLREIYTNVRASFDHLDGYLTLFTPLHRRLYRKPIQIKGSEIARFLEELFGERMRRHRIVWEVTPGFVNTTLFGFPSTFYPVFVNLVDNAIYWLKERPDHRTIRLDADGDSLIVTDNGPGVALRDRAAIFERGFTRKPGGQGMGLYISQETLRRVGYRLSLAPQEQGRGATFVIAPESPEPPEEED